MLYRAGITGRDHGPRRNEQQRGVPVGGVLAGSQEDDARVESHAFCEEPRGRLPNLPPMDMAPEALPRGRMDAGCCSPRIRPPCTEATARNAHRVKPRRTAPVVPSPGPGASLAQDEISRNIPSDCGDRSRDRGYPEVSSGSGMRIIPGGVLRGPESGGESTRSGMNPGHPMSPLPSPTRESLGRCFRVSGSRGGTPPKPVSLDRWDSTSGSWPVTVSRLPAPSRSGLGSPSGCWLLDPEARLAVWHLI